MRSIYSYRLGMVAALLAGAALPVAAPQVAGADAGADAAAPVSPAVTASAASHEAGVEAGGGDAAAELAAIADDLDMVGEGVVIGAHSRLDTPTGPIHVWTPLGYDPETALTVLYVHGYGTDVDEAWWGHGLPEQFGYSQVNAMFIACEAPTDPTDAVRFPSLSRLLAAVEASGRPIPRGRVVAIGHSGAYRTLEQWVRDPKLDTLVLLDAGYGYLNWVYAWIQGRRDRRLIDIGDDTRAFTDRLHAYLPQTVALRDFDAFTDPVQVARLARERIVYVRSTIGHFPIASGAIALPAVLRILGATAVRS